MNYSIIYYRYYVLALKAIRKNHDPSNSNWTPEPKQCNSAKDPPKDLATVNLIFGTRWKRQLAVVPEAQKRHVNKLPRTTNTKVIFISDKKVFVVLVGQMDTYIMELPRLTSWYQPEIYPGYNLADLFWHCRCPMPCPQRVPGKIPGHGPSAEKSPIINLQ